MSGRLNLAIIGMGRMGITHFSILNSHPEVKIRAVVEKSPLILKMISKYFKDIQVFEDYKNLLNDKTVDGVIICTPPGLHSDIATRCASLGIHVFAEKPFTLKYSDAHALSVLFMEKDLVNQVGYVNRYNDVFRKVRELLLQGVLGNVIRFRSEMYSRTIIRPVDGNTWRDVRDQGGGALYEMATHAIDLVNYIIGKPDKVVGSILTPIYSRHVEDAVSANFMYRDGKSGSLNINWSDQSYRKPTNKIEIFGSKGKIIADQHTLKLYLNQPHPELNLREGWNTMYITELFKPVPFYLRGNEFTEQLYSFVESVVKNNHKPLCSFDDAAATLEIVEAIASDFHSNQLTYAAN